LLTRQAEDHGTTAGSLLIPSRDILSNAQLPETVGIPTHK